ncbi:MAG: S41 family peptidase [bacterium]|nr:S41 family peptidase [bacterium]
MFLKSRFKVYILPAFLAGFLIALTFGLGVYVGSHQTPPPPVVSVDGKDSRDLEAFWRAWSTLNDKFVGDTKPTDQDKIWGAIEGLTASYKDPYTVFFPPVESKAFAEEVGGAFGGVGMEVGIKDNQLVVIAPLKETPAYRAGILPGDKILKIDGKDTTGMPVDAAVKLIRGEKGTTVKLLLSREDKKTPFEISVVRDVIDIPVIKTEFRKDGIFVIQLYNFSAPSPMKFREALREFINSGTDKLILDLRNNPGGYLEAATDIAGWFLPSNGVVVSEDFGKSKPTQYHRTQVGQNIFNDKLKMIILVNGGSASASEILAGALHDHNKARLLGEKTFGKGSVQELVPVTINTSLKVTIARWLTPNGISISKQGIVPDIEVKMTQDDFLKKGDIQLTKAAEILNKETASSSTAWILNTPQFTVSAE